MQEAVQSSDILLRELDDNGVLRLTMNDARRRNALSEAMLAVLGAAFVEAGTNAGVRVIILAANGPAFCAGHDLKEMTAGRTNPDGGKAYFKKLTSYISISLFIFLPIFTLFLKLIYIRRKYTYMEHLVFVFNTQTVFFLLLIIFYLCSFFFKMDNFGWIFALLFLFYLYKALRYFYEQGRTKTIIKYVLLNSYYMFLALVGFAIVAVLSFFIS